MTLQHGGFYSVGQEKHVAGIWLHKTMPKLTSDHLLYLVDMTLIVRLCSDVALDFIQNLRRNTYVA